MSIVAVIPVASLLSANATLEVAGYGPKNFSVAAYGSTGPTYAALHAWGNPAFQAALVAIPGVLTNTQAGDPVTRTASLISAQGAQWGAAAPELPASGNVLAGMLYRYADGALWWCIQSFNRTTFPAIPSTYPALIRQARIPGNAEPWRQPLDQFDAYHLVNPFTGKADECLHIAKRWRTSLANNVFTPGALNSGWVEIDANGDPIQAQESAPAPLAWVQPVGAVDAYKLGAKVTHKSQTWLNTGSDANVWEPGVFGWTVQP